MVSLFGSFESFQTQFVFIQSAEAKVFISYYIAVFHVCDGGMIIPDVPGILRDTSGGEITCKSRGIILIGIKAEYMESFRGYFCSFVFISLAVFGCPDFIFCIRIVGSDGNFTAFRHRFLIPFYMDWGYH